MSESGLHVASLAFGCVSVAACNHLLGCAFKDDLAAVASGLGADVDGSVCGDSELKVVFDND